MSDTTTTLISGRVTENGTRKGAFGLRVELWPRETHSADGRVAQALSDQATNELWPETANTLKRV